MEWAGTHAFPYLMHHPNSFLQSENYGTASACRTIMPHWMPGMPCWPQCAWPVSTPLTLPPAAFSTGHAGDTHAGPPTQHPQQAARTGTWDGPAPRGYVAEPMHAQDQPARAAARPVADPEFALLPGGVRMPLVGLGTYAITSSDSVRAAMAAGYRHVDCATVYDNQSIVGEGLSEYLSQPGARAALWVTSKVWNDEHRPEGVRASVARSLQQLGCQYLDLLLVHWPPSWLPGTQEPDEGVTLEQTWAAMEALVDEGLVRHLGLSNFSLRQVEAVLGWARHRPVVLQVELHPLLAQRKLVGVCARKGVVCVGYSPLGHSTQDLLTHPEVVAVAAEAGKTPAQVLLKWNVQRGVAVIPKASSEGHLRENLEGLFAWRLTWDQKSRLDAMDEGKRFVDFEWHRWDDAEEGGAVKPSKVLLSA